MNNTHYPVYNLPLIEVEEIYGEEAIQRAMQERNPNSLFMIDDPFLTKTDECDNFIEVYSK